MKTEKYLAVNISRSVLQSQLAQSIPFVKQKTTIPILSQLLFGAAADSLTITATDLENTMVATIQDVKVKSEGRITIPARKLAEVLQKIAKVPGMPEDLTIETLEDYWIRITCGAFTVKLRGADPINYPSLTKAPKDLITLDGKVLSTLIANTRHAVSNEESRYTLQGALLEIEAGRIRMIGTDGHRLAACSHETSVTQKVKVLVKHTAFDGIQALCKRGDVGFAQDENTLFFAVEGQTLTVRKLTGQFPNWQAVMPTDKHVHVLKIADSKALTSALTLVASFANERSGATKFTLEPGKVLTITAESTEAGSASQTVAGDYSGDFKQIGFNASLVLDWLKTVTGHGVVLRVRDEQSCGLFEPIHSDGYDYKAIVMPLRM